MFRQILSSPRHNVSQFLAIFFFFNYVRTTISRFAIFVSRIADHATRQQATEETRGKKNARYVALRRRSYVSPIILHVRRNS